MDGEEQVEGRGGCCVPWRRCRTLGAADRAGQSRGSQTLAHEQRVSNTTEHHQPHSGLFLGPVQGLCAHRASHVHERAFLPPPPSASHFRGFPRVLCPHPGVLRSCFTSLRKKSWPFLRSSALSRQRASDGRRAGSKTPVPSFARLCSSAAHSRDDQGVNVRLPCTTAAVSSPLLGDASVPVSCWEENATMLSRGRRSQGELCFPWLCLSS